MKDHKAPISGWKEEDHLTFNGQRYRKTWIITQKKMQSHKGIYTKCCVGTLYFEISTEQANIANRWEWLRNTSCKSERKERYQTALVTREGKMSYPGREKHVQSLKVPGRKMHGVFKQEQWEENQIWSDGGRQTETVPGAESWTKARERFDLSDKEGEDKQLSPNLPSFVHLTKKP